MFLHCHCQCVIVNNFSVENFISNIFNQITEERRLSPLMGTGGGADCRFVWIITQRLDINNKIYINLKQEFV